MYVKVSRVRLVFYNNNKKRRKKRIPIGLDFVECCLTSVSACIFSHIYRAHLCRCIFCPQIFSLCVCFFLRSWMLEWICLFLHRVPVTPRKYVQNNSVIQDVAGLNHDLFIGKWKNDSRRRIYTHWTGSNLIFQFSVAGNAHSNTKPLIAILHND